MSVSWATPWRTSSLKRFSTRVCSFFGRWLILIASSSGFAFASATSRFVNASIFIADRSMEISSFFSNQTFVICAFVDG